MWCVMELLGWLLLSYPSPACGGSRLGLFLLFAKIYPLGLFSLWAILTGLEHVAYFLSIWVFPYVYIVRFKLDNLYKK